MRILYNIISAQINTPQQTRFSMRTSFATLAVFALLGAGLIGFAKAKTLENDRV